jgi:hypothetical protein
VLIVLAIRVEPLGIGEAGRIAVAGRQHEDDGRAFGNGGTGNGDVGCCSMGSAWDPTFTAPTSVSAQTWKRGSSSRGTPSSSQITVTGSG